MGLAGVVGSLSGRLQIADHADQTLRQVSRGGGQAELFLVLPEAIKKHRLEQVISSRCLAVAALTSKALHRASL